MQIQDVKSYETQIAVWEVKKIYFKENNFDEVY